MNFINFELQLFTLILVLSSAMLSVNTDEILGCGGFVKSKVPIDFSKVEVKLLTTDGIQKYQTECAPNNGYYMVPFVDKGDFVLKVQPPTGWSFDPMSVNLHVDGINDPCSRGKDINFEFLGFTVSGQVQSVGADNDGPSDVTLTLSKQENSEIVATTSSLVKGTFQFPSILPGVYKIVASHKTYSFKQNEIQVTVEQSNVQCTSSIVVSGYDVHGKVSAAQLPVKDVHMLLFAENPIIDQVQGCNTSPPLGAENTIKSQKLVFICSAASDSKGSFLFPSLPSQEYILIPFHKAEHIEFDVEPQQLKFKVLSGSVILERNFAVTGFSVTGFVLDSLKGNPVTDAKVFVNGKQQATTNEKGLYRLQHMNRGMYKITLEKEDIFFPELTVRVGSDTPRLPDIIADKFSFCGSVEIRVKPSKKFRAEELSISISDKTGSKKVAKLEKDYSFCLKMSPGEYVISPDISKNLANAGVVLMPETLKVTIQNKPIKNIKFTQKLVDIQVEIICIDSCNGVRVEMNMEGEKNIKIEKVETKDMKKTADIIFRDCLPNTYHLKAIHEQWCWGTNKTTIIAKGNNENNKAEFKQSGFKLTCSISHDLDMAIHHNGALVNTFGLKKGRNQLCLAKSGKYELAAESCHKFDPQKIIYDTANAQPVVMQAVNHEMSLRVEATHPDDHLKIIVKYKKRGQEISLNQRGLKDKTSESYIYSSTYLAKDKESVEIIPMSSTLLFEPTSLTVSVNAEDCATDVATFKAFKGLFIEGSVMPKLQDVDIFITASEDSSVVAKLKTNEAGKYKIGPLNPRLTYTISASKEEYVFIQDENRKENFSAKKLSKIEFSVSVKDGGQPLAGVLVTISGGSYRSNSLTNDTGKLVLRKLEPGQYYYKAVMKEYEFQPSSQVVNLEEGGELKIEISGKRVAFSCHGVVTSLNGQAESDLSVQAFSVDSDINHAEEAVTNEQGEFRIKGLIPNTKYNIKVKKSELYNRVSPADININVGKDDVKDVRFIAFRSLSQFELSGNVVTSNEFLRYLKVVLYEASDLSAPVHSVSLASSPIFHLPLLPRDDKEYHIRLETSLDKSRYIYTEPAAGLFASGVYKHITFQFNPQQKALDLDTPQASYVTLPIAILLLILAYNHAKVLVWLQQVVEKGYSAYFNNRKDVPETVSLKSSNRKTRKDK